MEREKWNIERFVDFAPLSYTAVHNQYLFVDYFQANVVVLYIQYLTKELNESYRSILYTAKGIFSYKCSL